MPNPAHPDGSLLEFALVRDLDWIDDYEAEVGKEVETDLEELGVHGPALVKAIEPAPATTARRHPDQRLVTGTFKHHVPGTVILKIAELTSGQVTELECTPNHPFWCPVRQAFVRADELRPDQALESALPGQYRLVSITSRAGPTTVYNMEVDGQHVYYAGGFATLVHNSYDSRKLGRDLEKAGFPRPPGGYQAAHLVPTGKFSHRNKDVRQAIRDAKVAINAAKKKDPTIAINKEINGFWGLPGHAGTHTDRFFIDLGKELRGKKDPADVRAALDLMWERVKNDHY